MDNVYQVPCVLWNIYKTPVRENLAIAFSPYSVQGADVEEFCKELKLTKCFSTERLMLAGVSGEEIKISSCLQMLLHSKLTLY